MDASKPNHSSATSERGQPPRIGIALGDPSGIGPEVTLKALDSISRDTTRYLLIGDGDNLDVIRRQLGLPLEWTTSTRPAFENRITLWNPLVGALPADMTPGCRAAAEMALASLKAAGQLCLEGFLDGMVTAPLSKEAILNLGQKFVGQTEYLSEMAGASDTTMMLMGEDDRGRWLRVALVTTHLPLKDVAAAITAPKIELAVRRAGDACRALGLPRQRVAVCGLNPHAGEGGKIGCEEIEIVIPILNSMRAAGVDVVGPIPADTLFHYAYRGDYDAVVAMYHDQGLGPLKMVGFDRGINWTLGLPFVRTSPDHGTAYNIAGKGIASGESMGCAIELATRLILKKPIWT